MVRKIFQSIILLFTCVTCFCQAPQKINYQAVLRNNTSTITEQDINLRISILCDSVNGEAVYVEMHTPYIGSDGVVNVLIGGGEVESGNFASLRWDTCEYFIAIEAYNDDFSISNVTKLVSVPYSLYSDEAGTSNYSKDIFVDVSASGDTLYIGDNKWVIIPGISEVQNGITDIDGNEYTTLQIGNQRWMTENLKVTQYNDGSTILHTASEWSGQTTGAWCYYNNDSDFDPNHGKLYNWHAVNSDKLCPAGWHVPTVKEWTVLVEYLGGQAVAGGKMKEVGLAHWFTPNAEATDESDFTALPSGYRKEDGIFGYKGNYSVWWSASSDTDYSWAQFLGNNYGDAFQSIFDKDYGFSVRCVED
ncbi:MAG: fibrobacter succinogenes major paralogous domain-containing protein [Bacteroidales bacterium]|jgi:uncharacterized protein (TIGR02145 family)|nr:fibrobacter succinogenes major paralogous domain-containing protein [Bacteroidales bacterium]MDD3915005.1 fibrobacter succinogenes major paralogous domain-containing protein [Bacteroidales bacterium]MDD4633732.1 fibrobacter succinogenes major paralogous domain-containing protein [Bacteroidales bacterium]